MAGKQPGQRKDKQVRDALLLAVNRIHDGDPSGRRKLTVAAEKVVEAAVGGDLAAFQEIANRLDGRPAQIIEGGEDPIKFEDVTVARAKLAAKLAALVEPGEAAGSDQGPERN